MNIFKRFQQWIKKIDAESGYICDACGKEVFEYPLHRLCPECEAGLKRNENRTCPKCGRELVADGVCLTCKRELPEFATGFSPFVYQGSTAALINRIKNGNYPLCYFFGEKMAEYLINNSVSLTKFKIFNKGDIEIESRKKLLIVPVPMTEESMFKRGYNQAEKLAWAVYETLEQRGYDVELGEDVLQKFKETRAQKQLTYDERVKNVAGAFHVHKRKECSGRIILLVDDIMTTGATGSECAARLYGADALEVLFLTAASLPEQK